MVSDLRNCARRLLLDLAYIRNAVDEGDKLGIKDISWEILWSV